MLLSISSIGQIIFTIDGNPSDWFTHLRSTSPNIIAKSFQHDLNSAGVDVSIFTGGGSKDDLPMSGWLSGGNSTPPKDDILNAGSMLVINSPTDKKLLFFGDRKSVSGSAQIGLWFFLSPVRINPTTNKFENENGGAAIHTVGDLLVLCEFTNGGVQADVDVYKVISVSANGTPTFQSFLNTLGTGKTNAAAVTAPNSIPLSAADWPFFILDAQGNQVRTDWYYSTDSKGTILTQYPDNAFYEGYVDLAAMEAADPNANFCFTNFLMETRASHEISATLKDMVFGSFEVAPNTPEQTGNSRCGPGTVQLTGNCSGFGDATGKWYTLSNGVYTLVHTGMNFTTPSISTTTTYYFSCTRTDLGCEGDKEPIVATINGNPTITGDITIKSGITGGSPATDCPGGLYDMNQNITNTADLVASGAGTNGTYIWSALTTVSNPVDYTLSPLTSTSTGNATATFPIVNPPSELYRFKVIGTDANGCIGEDIVCVSPGASCPQPCSISGLTTPCENTQNITYSLADALDPLFTYTWTLRNAADNGPATNATIDGANVDVQSINVDVTDPGSFKIKVTLQSKGPYGQTCPGCTYDVTVNPDPEADAGANPASQCYIAAGNTFALSGTAANGTVAWTVESNPQGWPAPTFSNSTSASTNVTVVSGSGGGYMDLRMTVTSSFTAPACPPDYDIVRVTVLAQAAKPEVELVPITCLDVTFSIKVTNPVAGTTYTATQPHNAAYDEDYTYQGNQGEEVIFTGLALGKGYSVIGTIGSCVTQPEACTPVLPEGETLRSVAGSTTQRAENFDIKLPSNTKVSAAPNPFSDRVRFNLQSGVSGRGTLELFNMLGQKVHTVFDGYVEANKSFYRDYHVPSSQRTNLVYVFRVGDQQITGKLINLR